MDGTTMKITTTTTGGSSSPPELLQAAAAAATLNPSAKEFVPWCRRGGGGSSALSADAPEFVMSPAAAERTEGYYRQNEKEYEEFELYPQWQQQYGGDQSANYRRTGRYYWGRRKFANRAQRPQREEFVKRTVYVSEIDHTVTEEKLASLFGSHGNVMDCRICGDPNSALRFAFVEFADEYDAKAALSLDGTTVGLHPLKVLPSKTAILPVNPSFLPQSEDEREMCSRTVYCTNIDKRVNQMALRDIFETCCGEVSRIRLLGDHTHSTRIAFVEFVQADCAVAALNSSGMFVGGLPIRVSPSKTPIRPRSSDSTASSQ